MMAGSIKVCGLTRAQDVAAAASAGADLFGFVHHAASPRHVPLEDLGVLLAQVPEDKTSVLVVVEGQPDELAHLWASSGAQMLQLCGAQEPEEFEGFDAPLLRRIGVQSGALVDLARWSGVAQGFVLDHPSSAGGSGLLVDQDQARELAAAGPCLLAGGLGPATVAKAIREVQPLGVDASSRLECAPGEKDPSAMTAFVQVARAEFARQELLS